MKVFNIVFSALSGFLAVFFAHELVLAANPIAQAWGVFAVVLFAGFMVYLQHAE